MGSATSHFDVWPTVVTFFVCVANKQFSFYYFNSKVNLSLSFTIKIRTKLLEWYRVRWYSLRKQNMEYREKKNSGQTCILFYLSQNNTFVKSNLCTIKLNGRKRKHYRLGTDFLRFPETVCGKKNKYTTGGGDGGLRVDNYFQ